MLSFRTRITLGILLPLVLTVSVFLLALSLPDSPFRFYAEDDQLYFSQPTVTAGSTSAHPVQSFTVAGVVYPASSDLVLEEPDVLPSHSAIDALTLEIGLLTQALQEGSLRVTTDAGVLDVPLQKRRLQDLPWTFWLQAISALSGLLICTLVWLPGGINSGKAGFLLTGVSYFFLVMAACLYSSRNLFIDSSLFHALHLVNVIATQMFMAGLVLFLWNYPKSLLPRPVSIATPVLTLAMSTLAVFQVSDDLALTIYLPFTLMLAMALAGLITQWWKTRAEAGNRAILRWILLFMASVTLPGILKLYTDVPQAVMISAFVVMYGGMMVAVMRHRFFDIERWSYKLWGWFIGGLLVVITDLTLATLVSLSHQATLALSVFIVGWLWFPVRQRIWKRFFVRRDDGLQDWLTQSLPSLLSAPSSPESEPRLLPALRAVFSPLQMKLDPAPMHGRHQILSAGQTMQLNLGALGQVELSHPGEGRRQFRKDDLHTAELVLSLDDLIRRSQSAKEEGLIEGAQGERNRIRQDLHDDLGAKLLRLLHRSQSDNQPLVREAIRDLRQLLNTSLSGSVSLHAAVSNWQDEAQARCDDHGVSLTWQNSIDSAQLSETRSRHLEMAVRECLSNALRNLNTVKRAEIRVECVHQEKGLTVLVENDFDGPLNPEGHGLEHIRQRLSLVGGAADISQRTEGGVQIWSVQMVIPLS